VARVVLENLSKLYGAQRVVHDLNLTIEDKEFIALVGPSGCGKSTTLRMIAGLEEIASGKIFIGSRVVNDLRPRERNVSMVFQNYALFPHMTVRQNMSFGLRLAKTPEDEIAARINEAAAILGISDKLDRRPSSLSGGERQRVAMGRAMVRRPDVFLFDEPLSNLDAKLRTTMRTEIKRLHRQVETTVIYVTHDQVEAMTLADRIVVMRDGRIAQIGTPNEVFSKPTDVFVAGFIGSPPMNFLSAISSGAGRLRLANGLEMPFLEHRFRALSSGHQVIVGIRAEDIVPSGHGLHLPQAWEVSANVLLSEPLGSETLLITELGGEEVIAKMLQPVPVEPDQAMDFQLNMAAMHLFDAQSELSLAA
jgi:multiple sugar transport system ATP-binding protein